MRVLIADDHQVVSFGLRHLLSRHFQDINIKDAATGAEIIELLQGFQPDVLILDVYMPGVMHIGFISDVLSIKKNVKILIFSMLDEQLFSFYFLRAGVCGFVSKRSDFNVVVQAVKTLNDNGLFFTKALRENYDHLLAQDDKADPFATLSDREREVMLLLFNGYSNKEVADILGIAATSVSTYRSRISGKFDNASMLDIRDLFALLHPNDYM